MPSCPRSCWQPLDRGSQDVGNHVGRQGVPVVRRIAPSDAGRVDRRDEITSRRQMPGHTEGPALARDIEVEVPTVETPTRDAHPQQRPRTGILGHEDIDGNPIAACRRGGTDVHLDGGSTHAHRRDVLADRRRRGNDHPGSETSTPAATPKAAPRSAALRRLRCRLEGNDVGLRVTPSRSSENHTGSARADERSRGIDQLIR